MVFVVHMKIRIMNHVFFVVVDELSVYFLPEQVSWKSKCDFMLQHLFFTQSEQLTHGVE